MLQKRHIVDYAFKLENSICFVIKAAGIGKGWDKGPTLQAIFWILGDVFELGAAA